MTFLHAQVFVLLLASYFLGAFLACVAKRSLTSGRVTTPVQAPGVTAVEAPPRPYVSPPVPRPILPRIAPPVAPPAAHRTVDPVQPRIEVLRRPEPRAMPKLVNPARFERALMGPEPNEGIPRKAIVEIRPAVLKSPTGPQRRAAAPPEKPKAEPAPEPAVAPEVSEKSEPQAPSPLIAEAEVAKPATLQGRLSRLTDATTSAAAAAVAVAKAAAAALTASVQPRTDAKPKDPPPAQESREADDVKPATKSETADKIEPVTKAPIEGGDDFRRIRAIDADLEQKLKARGVQYFEHIASWNSADIKKISQDLAIPGRIDQEQWVEQAQILAKGGETYYSRNRRAAQKANTPASATPSIVVAALQAESSSKFPEPSAAPPATSATNAETAGSDPQSSAKPSGPTVVGQGRSVAEMAAAAAAAIAAASASVTRGLKPIEPISPLSKVDPRISMPAKLSDAIKEKEAAAAAQGVDKQPSNVIVAETNDASSNEGPRDDLKRIRGIGVLIEKRLNALGISRYDQIANWTSSEIDRFNQTLEFKGRIERESWVEQARILSSGGQTEFSRRVDRGEFDTSRET